MWLKSTSQYTFLDQPVNVQQIPKNLLWSSHDHMPPEWYKNSIFLRMNLPIPIYIYRWSRSSHGLLFLPFRFLVYFDSLQNIFRTWQHPFIVTKSMLAANWIPNPYTIIGMMIESFDRRNIRDKIIWIVKIFSCSIQKVEFQDCSMECINICYNSWFVNVKSNRYCP